MNRIALTLTLITVSLTHNANAADAADMLQAVTERDIPSVTHMIATGADVNTADDNGNTPLMMAAALGYTDLAAILVAAEADVNASGRIGNTSLIYATESGATDVARLLIEAGASVTSVNDYGNTALSLAIGFGHREIAELIEAAPAATTSPLAMAF